MAIAQINIGLLSHDLDAPEIADFANNLDRINTIAERSDGFIWRLKDASGNATSFFIENNPRLISNLSVWRDFECFEHFVFKTLHKQFFKRRAEWFEPMDRPSFAMWPIDETTRPTLAEGLQKLEFMQEFSESAQCFGWAYARKGKKAS